MAVDRQELVFAFDVGKASLGICARTDTEIKALKSLIIHADHGATKHFSTKLPDLLKTLENQMI
jgi:hypothetical protein